MLTIRNKPCTWPYFLMNGKIRWSNRPWTERQTYLWLPDRKNPIATVLPIPANWEIIPC